MKNTARAIILIDDDYVFMKREKLVNSNIVTFYATIGGHLEKNESFEEACIRETEEEVGIKVEIKELLYEFINEDLDKFEKFYLVEHISGNIGTGMGEEFIKEDFEKYGSYEIVKINREEVYKYNILPIEIKNILIEKNK